ncbi:MAG TPA: type II secretion system protein E [Spartobacteria bacterium]|jgi:type II secretion system protein E|nr:type II secretion system protein E [Spartobacteria bacterium]
MQKNETYVLDLLHDAGLVTRPQIESARSRLNGQNNVVDLLIRDGVVSEADVSRTLAGQAHMDWIDISSMVIPPVVIKQIRAEDARRFKVVPVAFGESGLIVAVGDPLDIDTIDSLSFLLQREIELVCTSPAKIREALIKYYGTADEAADVLQEKLGADVDLGLEIGEGAAAVEGDETDAPIIRMVSMLLIEAHRLGASDIHLEPLDKKFRVRFRIDGVLQEMQAPPKRLQSAIISRLKIMTGSMSIAEKRLPQDGRIQVKIKKKPIDLRVSTIPTNHGESVVMRVLDKSSLILGLPELGFFSDDQETFERLIKLPDGILLVTGPTGSGKTTTLYACLHYINKPDRKIITVEEPIEYQMNGINQVQVNPEIGMTFPAALRSILRQAPNVIMIGEIRDLETANIATAASLTGHLVFSTLHTNDAPSAVARLVDIGVQPFLVASSIRAIMAQRLVRRLCSNCKEPAELSETELRALRIEPGQVREAQVMKPVGCEQCRKTGYRGRLGIFEIFVIDDEVRHMINKRSSTLMLRQRARELGMRTLREDGVRKILGGVTSAEEVISTTIGDVS